MEFTHSIFEKLDGEGMLNSRILTVASSKGGVGKTTVALGIANALCYAKKKVLLCDLDFDNKCLDMFMGLDEISLYNIADVAMGTVKAEKAVVSNGDGLSFVPASVGITVGSGSKQISEDDLIDALKKVIDVKPFDFVIIDTPAGNGISNIVSKAFPSSEGIVVASHQPASRQGAENTARMMSKNGVKNIRLVITGFETVAASDNSRSGVIDIIDSSKVQLIGVVPYDRILLLSHERGVMAPMTSCSSKAFSNIARRICGENVPLFTGINIKKYKVY